MEEHTDPSTMAGPTRPTRATRLAVHIYQPRAQKFPAHSNCPSKPPNRTPLPLQQQSRGWLTDDFGCPRTKHPTPIVLHRMQVAAALSTLLSVAKSSSPSGNTPLLPPAECTMALAPRPTSSSLSSHEPPAYARKPGSSSCIVRNMVLTMALRMKLGSTDEEREGGGARRMIWGNTTAVLLGHDEMRGRFEQDSVLHITPCHTGCCLPNRR